MTIHVKRIELLDSPDQPEVVRLAAEVVVDYPERTVHSLWVEVSREHADALSLSGNPWLVALSIPASLDRQPLRIDAPVDAELYQQVHQLMRIWHTWGWTPQPIVPIEANVTASLAKSSNAGRTGLYFSGGVDSMFSLLTDNPTHYPERCFQIDDLMNVWGLNERATDRVAFEHGWAERQRVARVTGKSLVIVRTNLREVMWRPRLWEWAHPMLMAAVGLALESRYRRILVASDADYSGITPKWVHPLEVPLFSTRELEFQHDGGAYTRAEKLTMIAGNELVQQTLNVCIERTGRKLNCGRCLKCLRTMVMLDLAGMLPAFSVFDASEYPQAFAVAAISLNDRPDVQRLLKPIEAHQRHDLAPWIKGVLRRCDLEMLTRRARVEQRLAAWVMPARAARWVGRTIDRAYTTVARRYNAIPSDPPRAGSR